MHLFCRPLANARGSVSCILNRDRKERLCSARWLSACWHPAANRRARRWIPSGPRATWSPWIRRGGVIENGAVAISGDHIVEAGRAPKSTRKYTAPAAAGPAATRSWLPG